MSETDFAHLSSPDEAITKPKGFSEAMYQLLRFTLRYKSVVLDEKTPCRAYDLTVPNPNIEPIQSTYTIDSNDGEDRIIKMGPYLTAVKDKLAMTLYPDKVKERALTPEDLVHVAMAIRWAYTAYCKVALDSTYGNVVFPVLLFYKGTKGSAEEMANLDNYVPVPVDRLAIFHAPLTDKESAYARGPDLLAMCTVEIGMANGVEPVRFSFPETDPRFVLKVFKSSTGRALVTRYNDAVAYFKSKEGSSASKSNGSASKKKARAGSKANALPDTQEDDPFGLSIEDPATLSALGLNFAQLDTGESSAYFIDRVGDAGMAGAPDARLLLEILSSSNRHQKGTPEERLASHWNSVGLVRMLAYLFPHAEVLQEPLVAMGQRGRPDTPPLGSLNILKLQQILTPEDIEHLKEFVYRTSLAQLAAEFMSTMKPEADRGKRQPFATEKF